MRKIILRFVLLSLLLFTLLQQYSVVKAESRDCQSEFTICIASTFNVTGCENSYMTCMRGTPPKQNPPVVIVGESDYEWLWEIF